MIPFDGILVLTGMTTAGLASLGYAAWEWHRRVQLAEAARHWSVVSGRIVSAEVIVHKDSDGDEYEARVRYAYRAGNRDLVGTRIRAGGKMKSAYEDVIRSAVAPYRTGDRVMVRYDPAAPERALLEAVPSRAGFTAFVAMGVFMLGSSAYTFITMSFPSPFR